MIKERSVFDKNQIEGSKALFHERAYIESREFGAHLQAKKVKGKYVEAIYFEVHLSLLVYLFQIRSYLLRFSGIKAQVDYRHIACFG